eukprot:4024143-Amphidinium_carterae.1
MVMFWQFSCFVAADLHMCGYRCRCNIIKLPNFFEHVHCHKVLYATACNIRMGMSHGGCGCGGGE